MRPHAYNASATVKIGGDVKRENFGFKSFDEKFRAWKERRGAVATDGYWRRAKTNNGRRRATALPS